MNATADCKSGASRSVAAVAVTTEGAIELTIRAAGRSIADTRFEQGGLEIAYRRLADATDAPTIKKTISFPWGANTYATTPAGQEVTPDLVMKVTGPGILQATVTPSDWATVVTALEVAVRSSSESAKAVNQ